ncbi:hypothetical protein [Spongiactinospora sp. TRM90649]|uniref:hypothetical protein n=1 Tax=Spongiactinospora sp. TRM90649 TaxID=3031114 RepID=UPI0023F83023|nr:hypothetical protein [Spongiactinospora sp. TRM90649]MDF5755831.1 hypothetical protein [Spongiactinospora sp. TRM90649]
MAGLFPLRIDQGATLDRLITWTNAAGVPIDVTGWSAAMQIRERAGGALYAELSTSGGQIILGGAAGTIRLRVAASVTAEWVWERGSYDLVLSDADGQKTRLLEGPAMLSAAVTV